MSWRGLLSGSLVLVALQAALSSDEATGRVGRMFGTLADMSRRLIDPSVAAIPDLAAAGGAPTVQKPERGKANGKQDQDDDAPLSPEGHDLFWWLPIGMR